MKHSLEVDSIMLEFDQKRVLQDIYLSTETGKITGILGRNGSGKSYLINNRSDLKNLGYVTVKPTNNQ